MAKNDSLRRRRPSREPKPRFLIVCEGEVTEPHYFNEFRRLSRKLIDLKIVPAGVPKTVVQQAVKLKNKSEEMAKRSKDENLRYEYVWCLFDIDEHPNVDDAKQQARDNFLNVAISNPCFELWLLLHFQDQNAHIGRKPLKHLCIKHMPGYVKTPFCGALFPNLHLAIERAATLDKRHESNNKIGANPSTGVYRLIQQIQLL